MCCEGCGEDAPCTAPAKCGVAGLILFLFALVLSFIFSLDIVTSLGSDTERLIIGLTVVLPTGIGFIISSIGFCCMPNGDYPFCFFRCKNGRTLPLITMILNFTVCLIFGVVISFAG
eukprot:457167_1